MKKPLLFLASLLMSVATFAQWTKPAPNATDMVLGDTLYLYNVEAAGFLVGANNWGTRASVGSTGYKVIIKTAYEDEEETVPTGYYWICDSVESQNAVKAVFADAAGDSWVDNLEGANVDMWTIKKTDGYYQITNEGYKKGAPYGVAEYYEGKTGNTRLYFYDASLTYTYDDGGEDMVAPLFSGEFWSKWVFLSPAEYANLQPKVAAYRAAVSLRATIDAAKAEYPNLDFSAPEAVYSNTNSTEKQLQEAEVLVGTIINDYKSSLASFDNPFDFTEQIGDGSDFGFWTREFTGSGKVGDTATNTWSTEANNGGDGTDMLTPFCQVWTGSGGILSDQKIYQVLKAAAPGLYKFTANVRIYNEAGGVNALTGATMYFGDKSMKLEDEVAMYKSGSKCVLWSKDYFTLVVIVKEGGDIEFGFDIKEPTFNWIAFKNTSLLYYGNEDVEANAAKLLKSLYSFEKVEEDTPANAGVIKAYNEAVDAFDAATAEADIKAAAVAANAAKDALDTNIAAYETLYNKIDEWEENIVNNPDLEGSNWDDYCDFVQSDMEIEGYPTPNPTVIKEQNLYPFTTEEIEKYISTVDSLYRQAVATSLVPGADCTNMLTNASFNDGFTGWTAKNVTAGGLKSFPSVETFGSVVDCYQVIKDAPDGIYSLSCRAFERPDENGKYDGTEESKVFIFMNDFQTPVQNIVKDGLPKDEAVNYENCFIDGDINEDYYNTGGTTNKDYLFDGELYVPNGMSGASYAFRAGRYEQKVYGLVSGGEMKVGITSNGVSAHWVLWSDFHLTYEGKSAKAIAEILPTYVEQLQTYLDENGDNMTEPVATAVGKIADDADGLTEADDVEELWQALQNVNKALADAKANVVAVEAYNVALDELSAAHDSSKNPEGLAAYDEIEDQVTDAMSLTTEELIALTEKMEEVTYLLKLPSKEASDSEPADCTSLIENADIEAGATVAWQYTKNGGNGPALDNGLDGTKSIEFWNEKATNLQFNVWQTLSKLPAGKYELSADASNSLNGQADAGEEGRAYLYAITSGGVAASTAVAVQEAGCTEAYDNYSVIFTLAEGENVTIGFQSVGTMTARWFVADNFTLTYYGTGSAKADTEDNGQVDIADIDVNAASIEGIYTISGTQVTSLQKGINIVKYADGTIKKVLVK